MVTFSRLQGSLSSCFEHGKVRSKCLQLPFLRCTWPHPSSKSISHNLDKGVGCSYLQYCWKRFDLIPEYSQCQLLTSPHHKIADNSTTKLQTVPPQDSSMKIDWGYTFSETRKKFEHHSLGNMQFVTNLCVCHRPSIVY